MLTSMYAFVVQIIFYIVVFTNKDIIFFNIYWIITDLIINIAFILLLFLNGFWRIIILSRRLNIIKKIIFVCLSWIPIVNFVVILILCHAALIEYDQELYKINQNKWRVESQICKTKYPIIMLHGVGFRDLKIYKLLGQNTKGTGQKRCDYLLRQPRSMGHY